MNKNNRVSAIILAAGRSERMGQAKMLLPWKNNQCVLEAVIDTFAAAEIKEIVVVTGADADLINPLLIKLKEKYPIRDVHNKQFNTGEMLSSLQAGLAGLSPEAESALVGLGDQPQMKLQTVKDALSAAETSSFPLIMPSWNDRRGHPWLVKKQLWTEIFALKIPETARTFIQNHSQEIEYFAADESILQDLDWPQDYEKFLKNDTLGNLGEN